MKMRMSSAILIYSILFFGIVIIGFPIYLTVVSVFKTRGELAAHFFALPQTLRLDNLQAILQQGQFYQAFYNSFIISLICLVIMSFMLPMLSYPISRKMKYSRFYRFLYYFFLAGLFIPFQVRMMPLIRMLNIMNIQNLIGVIIVYLGYSVCEGVFLFVGFLSSIPNDLEESAYIDGANTSQIFFRIVYPLLKPITVTVIIKNSLWIWNDFFMPMLVLNKAQYRTLPLFQFNYQSEHAVEYPMVFTVFLLSMIPIMIVYIFLQKQIIGGIMSGAIKG